MILGLALAGCGGKVVFDGSDLSPCERACARVVPVCGDVPGGCAATCQSETDKLKGTQCGDLNTTLTDCIVNAPDAIVCGPAKGVPASCQSLDDEVQGCIASPSGG